MYVNVQKNTPAGFRFKVLLEQTALTNIRTFTNLNTLTNAFKTGFRFKVAASLLKCILTSELSNLLFSNNWKN